MPNIFNTIPYPWHEEAARQLHEYLTLLHPSSQGAILMAKQAKVKIHLIFTDQAIFFLWKSILEQAALDGRLKPLVQFAQEALEPTHPMRIFFEDLLQDRAPTRNPEPRGRDGHPGFDDSIGQPEALLFHDDLTIQIGKVPSLIKTLDLLLTLAPSVCKLSVTLNGGIQNGTAFRISDDLLLTNWHVLHNNNDGTRATAVTAEFGFEDDGRGGFLNTNKRRCDVATIVTNQPNDWAIVKPEQPFDNTIPIIKLSQAKNPVVNTETFIIQHPMGESKRLGFVRNQISSFGANVVHYLTDTQTGSSGSPVFDAGGALIALHHRGGRVQEVPGKPPLRKNEGILISTILQDLNAAGVNVP